LGSLRKLFEGRRKLFWCFAAGALALDLGTKGLLWHHPDERWPGVTLVPGFFRLVSHPGNPQGAFGLGPDSRWFFVVAAAVGLVVIGALLLSTPPRQGLMHAALGLLAGGALGNAYDRVFLESVRDFLDLHWRDAYHWPTFNMADVAICVGFGLVVYRSFVTRKEDAEGQEAGGAA